MGFRKNFLDDFFGDKIEFDLGEVYLLLIRCGEVVRLERELKDFVFLLLGD